ncbi:hypothetical protein [Streptomyces sp. AcH 505]|uniref:hypothetical protein n=1 Tax=Streptomyces sp. AcH 505 TaxID=352211 RepID=UPI000A5031E0
MGHVNASGIGRTRRFPQEVRFRLISARSRPMADVAFVLTTIAVFALVALIAKGVAKL